MSEKNKVKSMKKDEKETNGKWQMEMSNGGRFKKRQTKKSKCHLKNKNKNWLDRARNFFCTASLKDVFVCVD